MLMIRINVVIMLDIKFLARIDKVSFKMGVGEGCYGSILEWYSGYSFG